MHWHYAGISIATKRRHFVGGSIGTLTGVGANINISVSINISIISTTAAPVLTQAPAYTCSSVPDIARHISCQPLGERRPTCVRGVGGLELAAHVSNVRSRVGQLLLDAGELRLHGVQLWALMQH